MKKSRETGIQEVKIFAASSGELQKEREELVKIIHSINKPYKYLKLDVVKWETDIPPGSYNKKRIQDEINPLLEDCPIVIVLIYSKIGKFTLEEFNLALTKNKKIFLYFKKGFSPGNVKENQNYQKVLEFRERVEEENRILVKDFENIAEFKNLILGNLPLYLNQTFPRRQTADDRAPGLLTGRPLKIVEFVGRQKEMKEVGRLLKTSQRLVLVNGLGGVGKTELCKSFFYHHEKDYQYLAWVDYAGSLKESFISQLKIPGIDPGAAETMDERFAKIMTFLNGLSADSLLIIDNVDDPGDEDLPKIFSLRCKVLVSSRLKLKGFTHFDLDFLGPEACRELFYNFYKGERDDKSLQKIIELAGNHTLTVELLARTAQNSASSLTDFLRTLQEKGFNLNQVIPEQVETLWNNETEKRKFFDHLLVVFDLSGLTGEELAILTNLSLLPALYIGINDLCAWLKLQCKDEINSLVKKGWLRQSGFQVFLHQVMTEVIFYRTQPNCEKCEQLITSMANNLFCKPGDNPLKKTDFMPFADSILNLLQEEHKELATLANNLSAIYINLGQLDKALEFSLKDLKICEKVLKKDHPSLATSYNNVSTIYRDMGKLEKALEFQLKSLQIREKIYDKDHPSLAASYNNISYIYQDLGRNKEALKYAQKAVAIMEKLFPEGHPNLDLARENLEWMRKKT